MSDKTTTHQQVRLNGLDVKSLKGTIRTLKEQPDLARLTLRAHNRWISGAHGQTRIQDFNAGGKEDDSRREPFVLEADEPEPLLGEDHGPNATEALLHALASCLNTTFIYHAAARGVKVEELELELEGDLDLRGFLGISPEVRNGYAEIRVTFKVKADATPQQIEQLCQLAQRRSPVFDMLTHGVPVVASVEAK